MFTPTPEEAAHRFIDYVKSCRLTNFYIHCKPIDFPNQVGLLQGPISTAIDPFMIAVAYTAEHELTQIYLKDRLLNVQSALDSTQVWGLLPFYSKVTATFSYFNFVSIEDTKFKNTHYMSRLRHMYKQTGRKYCFFVVSKELQ